MGKLASFRPCILPFILTLRPKRGMQKEGLGEAFHAVSRNCTPHDPPYLSSANSIFLLTLHHLTSLDRFGPLKEIWLASYAPFYAFIVFRRRADAEAAVKESDGEMVQV